MENQGLIRDENLLAQITAKSTKSTKWQIEVKASVSQFGKVDLTFEFCPPNFSRQIEMVKVLRSHCVFTRFFFRNFEFKNRASEFRQELFRKLRMTKVARQIQK